MLIIWYFISAKGAPYNYLLENPCLQYIRTTTIFVILLWFVSSSAPGAAYIRLWIGSALLQIMACRLFSAMPLSKPMLGYWTPRNKLRWKFNQNTKLFINENASENIVCEMAAILFLDNYMTAPGPARKPVDDITCIHEEIIHTCSCRVTLDISGSPIDCQWGSRKYPG